MIKAQCVLLSLLVARTNCKWEGYIVGGKSADISEYPHAAYLSLSCIGKGSWICGSSIINQNLVLTAAHCLYPCGASLFNRTLRITITVGTSRKNQGHKSSGDNFVIHEGFDGESNDHDIALVKMKWSVSFGPTVKRVVIMKEPPSIKDAEVAGWGLINEDPRTHTVDLMSLSQVIWNTDDCEDLYGTIGPGSFCAGSLVPERYVARGDSGSALMVNGYIQIGIVSYKIPEFSDELIVYTNASYYLNWIELNAEKLYCNT